MFSGNVEKVLRVFYEGNVESEGRISHDSPFHADAAWVAESTGLSVEGAQEALESLEKLEFILPETLHAGRYHVNQEKLDDIEKFLASK